MIVISLVITLSLLTLGVILSLSEKHPYTPLEISFKDYKNPQLVKTQQEKLPQNYQDIVNENNLKLEKENIYELLNYGYTTIPNNKELQYSNNTPLLLTSENITNYFNQEINNQDLIVKENIKNELRDINKKAQIISSVLNIFPKEKDQDNFLLALDILDKKVKYLDLKNIEKSLGVEQTKNTNRDNTSKVSNTIYLEENTFYYTNIKDFIIEKKDLLKKHNLYTNQYENLLEDIDNIIKKDSSKYKKFVNFEDENILLYTTQEGILTISTTSTNNHEKLENNNFNTDYDITPTTQPNGTVRIPVLMYHQIGYAPKNSSSFVTGLYLSPDEFEKQIAYLTKKNYKTISSQEFLEILKSGKNPDQKTVMLTFDDGVTNHYTTAYPILKKYNQKGTFFIPSHNTQISQIQLKEMSDNGMDIQSHSQTHPNLVKITDLNQLQKEIGGSKSELQTRTNQSVISIAYPGCVANTEVFNSVSSNGYSLGFSCGKSIDHRYSNRFSLSRLHSPHNIDDLVKILSGIYPF